MGPDDVQTNDRNEVPVSGHHDNKCLYGDGPTTAPRLQRSHFIMWPSCHKCSWHCLYVGFLSQFMRVHGQMISKQMIGMRPAGSLRIQLPLLMAKATAAGCYIVSCNSASVSMAAGA